MQSSHRVSLDISTVKIYYRPSGRIYTVIKSELAQKQGTRRRLLFVRIDQYFTFAVYVVTLLK